MCIIPHSSSLPPPPTILLSGPSDNKLLTNKNVTNQMVQLIWYDTKFSKPSHRKLMAITRENLYLVSKSSNLQLFIMPDIEPWMGIIFPIPAVENIIKDIKNITFMSRCGYYSIFLHLFLCKSLFYTSKMAIVCN